MLNKDSSDMSEGMLIKIDKNNFLLLEVLQVSLFSLEE
jgi:hypothetical protein